MTSASPFLPIPKPLPRKGLRPLTLRAFTPSGTHSFGRSQRGLPQRHQIAGNAAVVVKGRRGNAVHRACGNGSEVKDVPQRHRIAGNDAVVAKGRRGDAVHRACRKGSEVKAVPQRHRIAGNDAVVVKGRRGDAVHRACRNGSEVKAVPQRHRIAGNDAVVAKGRRGNAEDNADYMGYMQFTVSRGARLFHNYLIHRGLQLQRELFADSDAYEKLSLILQSTNLLRLTKNHRNTAYRYSASAPAEAAKRASSSAARASPRRFLAIISLVEASMR